MASHIGDIDDALLQSSYFLRNSFGFAVLQPALDAAEGDRQRCKLLVDVVVQIAGDARAFCFLRRYQPPGEACDFVVGSTLTPPLYQQSGDQRGLQGANRERARNGPPVFFPQ